MLSRFIFKPSHLRYLTLISSQTHSVNPKPISKHPLFPLPTLYFFPQIPHFYSTNNGNHDPPPDLWKISPETDQTIDSFFSEESGAVDGAAEEMRAQIKASGVGGNDDWPTADGFKPWDFAVGEDEGEKGEDIFADAGLEGFDDVGEVRVEEEESQEDKQLEAEEKALSAILKGPNRAFGDLVATSGITEEMLDGLIALKDLGGIQGLPPLREIEDMRYEKNTRKSSRAEIERQKQEEVARARVREVDNKGRAYGTGKRKCSIARVWVQPGDGKFTINDKEFDVYFPMLDHRAALLRPFSETKTLGMWDIKCTVKGGGVSGQVGAVQLGISRALQCWDPELRPPLREAGFLTRDSRVVERKKPGKAKARKSFQWVKR